MAKSARGEARSSEPTVDKKEEQESPFKHGEEVVVKRSDGSIDDGWKIAKNYGSMEKIQVVKTIDGKEESKWIPTPELIDMNKGGEAIEALEADESDTYERIGSHMEVKQIGGPDIAAVYAGGNEHFGVLATGGIEGIPVRTAIKMEGEFALDVAAMREATSLAESYDSMVDAMIATQGLDDTKAAMVKAVAGARKGIFLGLSARAEKPTEMLNGMLTNLLERSPVELLKMAGSASLIEIDSQQREAERAIMTADTPERMAPEKVAANLDILAARERRDALATEKQSEADKAERAADAAGFVELMNYPIYQGEDAAENTRARVKEIEGEMEAFDKMEDSERTSAMEIKMNELNAERKRHMVALPTLETFEGLQKKIEEVDERVDSTIAEHVAKIGKTMMSIGGKIGNRNGRIKILDSAIERLNGFADYWAGHPEAESASAEIAESAEKILTLQKEVVQIRKDEENLKTMGVALDFSPSKEIEPEKTAMFKHFEDLAKDGHPEVVAEYIQKRLEDESISSAEKEVLSKALEYAEARSWVPSYPFENWKDGDMLNIEWGDEKFQVELAGVTADGRILLRESDGVIRPYERDFVEEAGILLDERSVAQAELIEKSMASESAAAEVSAKEVIANESTLTEATALELDLTPAEIGHFKNYYEAITDVLKAANTTLDTYQLPSSWSEFLSAKKKTESTGVMGWLKKKLGGQSEQEKMLANLMEATVSIDESFESRGVPAETMQRLRDARNKSGIKIQMPGNL